MKKIYALLWTIGILSLGIFYGLWAPKEAQYSETENRNLAGWPKFSIDRLISGDYGQDMEAYLLDRFPKRDHIIKTTNEVMGQLSFASYEEYLLIAEEVVDPLDNQEYEEELEDLLEDIFAEESEGETGSSDVGGTEEGDSSEDEPSEDCVEIPAIVQKPVAIPGDYPEMLGVYMDIAGGLQTQAEYARDNVLAVTAVLNKYAELLPQNGKLMFTVVPQSRYANQFVNASEKKAYYANWDDVVNAFSKDNVYAFDAAEILAPAIMDDEYVYFRTDMHWTPYGSYLVYKEMVKRAGLNPCDYDDDFIHVMETPFRGTYYRDNAAAYIDIMPDDLDILTPNCLLEWRRITGKDEYQLIDFIDMDARQNDRYTVYLSGPGGPWTYADCRNEKEENCLVIMDSFGLGYLPFLTQNYKQVHYYDPRYFSQESVGYSVAEMMEKYEIHDIYVIVGDIHSFNSSFILNSANSQLYGD